MNTLYPLFKQALLASTPPDLSGADLRAILVDTALYTYNAAHDFLDDVPVGSRGSTSVAIATPTIALGVLDTADFEFPAVPNGVTYEAIILYIHTGATEADRRLVAYYDTGVAGLPITGNGQDVLHTVNASGWFAL